MMVMEVVVSFMEMLSNHCDIMELPRQYLLHIVTHNECLFVVIPLIALLIITKKTQDKYGVLVI